MVKAKVYEQYKRHRQPQSIYQQTDDLVEAMKNLIKPDSINTASLVVLGKIKDRDQMYVFEGGRSEMVKAINDFGRHIRHMDIQLASPIIDMLLFSQYADLQIRAVLFTVIFFLFIVDSIVIYSMMITDVEERTYEFAMLRTLGFKKSSLMVLLVLQALFFSIPATALGFLINYLFTSLAQLLLYWYAGIRLQV